MIILSTFTLTLENPFEDPNGTLIKTLEYCDTVFTSFFILELILKVITYGFIINGKKSYIRDGWNIIDFLIVFFAIFSFTSVGGDLKFLKALRMIRVIRPLRVISRNEGLKIAVLSLINSIRGIFHVFIITILFFTLFGIFGINYFKGAFRYCHQAFD